METPTLTPCPSCGADARLCPDRSKPGQFFVGCSNEINCPVWPVTRSKTTEQEARAAWEAGETI
ncbi:MAG: hypothetical protein ABIS50_15285 [Luteolibacter sp.]|uniref:hypothetical protein n=1 Tax=Luteolibacter sp. TaxID=1962973 RepID=UPI0032650DED